jgi:DNA-binding transcriptional LysR family regulator
MRESQVPGADGGSLLGASTPHIPGSDDVNLLQGVATTGTVRGAAKSAGLTQSVATRRLTRLERLVGYRLVERGRFSLRLTDRGQVFLTAGRRYLDTLRITLRMLAVEPVERRGADGVDVAGTRGAEPRGVERSLGLVPTEAPSEHKRRSTGLEPEDLRVLRAVAEYGSLNRAAPVLLITQPALTRRIRRLECRLGMVLLLRGHRGTRLTPGAGKLLDIADVAETEFRGSVGPVRTGRPILVSR